MRTEAQKIRNAEYSRWCRKREKELYPEKDAERCRRYRHDNHERVTELQRARRDANPDRYYLKNLKSYLKRKLLPKTEAVKECQRRHSRRREIKRCKDQVALDIRIIDRADAIVPAGLSRFTRASIIAVIAARVLTGHLPMRLTKAHGLAVTAEIIGKENVDV